MLHPVIGTLATLAKQASPVRPNFFLQRKLFLTGLRYVVVGLSAAFR